MTDAEREASKCNNYKNGVGICFTCFERAIKEAEQRGRENYEKCTCSDNKWESICDYCFLQSARLQGNEVYRKGLLRGKAITEAREQGKRDFDIQQDLTIHDLEDAEKDEILQRQAREMSRLQAVNVDWIREDGRKQKQIENQVERIKELEETWKKGRAKIKSLESKLEKIVGMCGYPDASQACRNILQEITKTEKEANG